ncbi:P-loop NTPase family protein [Sinomonas albida]|uniref:cell division protein ZapE n=1 Tax=Sinomonas albida TaxID=369942 RepID=UPI0010A8FA34|nr:cell division protein ZapE [Sinomonas albida]
MIIDNAVNVEGRRAGWSASRVLVPGTAAQLGAFGLFAPAAGAAVVLPAGNAGMRALAADRELLWLTFVDVARAAADGADWASLAPRHALWVVSGVPVLAVAPRQAAEAFRSLAETLRAADVPLFVVALADPGPLPEALPVETADDGGLPPADLGT